MTCLSFTKWIRAAGQRGDDMKASENQECEFYRMRAAELEKAENMNNKVMDIIDNAKQEYRDILYKSRDDKEKTVAQNKWIALDDIQKEINQLQL